MAVYLKEFETQAAYEAAQSGLILPNVSLIVDNNIVHYNPYVPPTPVETRVVAKFNVTDTSNPTQIISEYAGSPFSAIEIDGIEQPSVVKAYSFNTTGEHTVKYTLTNPTSIGTSAFRGCTSLTSIDIPNSVTSIGDYAFSNCSGLTSIDIPSGVTSIGNQSFYNCSSLTSIEIPSGVTSISDYVFDSCTGLTSIDIPDSVTSIGRGVFSDCISLTSIEIPSGVTIIGDYAFQGCSGLISITCNATTAPTIDSQTFISVKKYGTLKVPSGSSGYDTWMQKNPYYLGLYTWTKAEQ